MATTSDGGRLAAILADMIRSAMAWDEQNAASDDGELGLDASPPMYTLSANTNGSHEVDAEIDHDDSQPKSNDDLRGPERPAS